MSVDTGRGPTIIAPVDFRGVERAPRPRRSPWRILVPALLVLLVVGLVGAGWFVLTARQIELTFDPPADQVELDGPPLRFSISGHYLLRPGDYRVHASRPGYHPLDASFSVGADRESRYHFTLEKLPGRLDVHCVGANAPDVALPEVDVEIDGKPGGRAPLVGVELRPGVHTLILRCARYRDLQTEIDILGEGRTQTLELQLRPGWADVAIASSPVRAEVWVDGSLQASTPCRLELDAGSRDIELRADGFEVWRRRLEVVAETPVSMEDIVLAPARGRLVISTRPPGAQVTIDGAYAGTSPVETTVAPDRDHEVHAARDGFDPAARTVRVDPGETVDVDLELLPQIGIVRFDVLPADATLYVDGAEWGPVPPEISLPALAHVFEFRKSGFVPASRAVRLRPDLAQRVQIELAAVRRELPAEAVALNAANGYALKLIRPGEYTMGASRGERGRRTNETLRSVRLERAFYMGVHEVTNDEFREFRADHQSGEFDGLRLNMGSQPAVQMRWDDAARFCNWLSARDRLAPAYVERDGRMEAASPLPNGYRLPTEAEWEYCARENGSGTLLKYPWGAKFPPTADSGNFADESASRHLALTIPEYDDGHAGAAPVASFDADGRGLYDLGGNVAEWCHDFYSIYPYDDRRVDVDPIGPERGRHHVIRGSSWRHSSADELRFSYRDYSADRRDDVGFRICRYLTSPEESP